MASPIEKIIAAYQAYVADRLNQLHDFFQIGQSPIEKILFIALVGAVEFSGAVFTDLRIGGNAIAEGRKRDPHAIYVTPQAAIGTYRADFLVEVFGGTVWEKLVVECDGHDFHERTKEQAAHDRSRDRSMQAQGYTVYRFTGAEIYRDPVKCANQIIEWAHKEAWKIT